jgi:hypothetical protein
VRCGRNSVWVGALGADREIMKIGRCLGCGGKGVAEMWRGQCYEIVIVSAVGRRARIWGRGVAAASGREAAGVGLGCVGGLYWRGWRVRCRGYVQSYVRVIAQRLRGVAVGMLVYGSRWAG